MNASDCKEARFQALIALVFDAMSGEWFRLVKGFKHSKLFFLLRVALHDEGTEFRSKRR